MEDRSPDRTCKNIAFPLLLSAISYHTYLLANVYIGTRSRIFNENIVILILLLSFSYVIEMVV